MNADQHNLHIYRKFFQKSIPVNINDRNNYYSSPQNLTNNDQNYLLFSISFLVFISLFVLLCITPICVCIRCCCRRSTASSRRPDSNQPENARNVAPAALELVYEARTTLCFPSSVSLEAGEKCSICLNEYGNQDSVRVLTRCRHMFHKHCIDQWLPGRSWNCPICREDLTVQ
ncbi:hypothetical protein LWI29_021794 [Acer saccharum]|uniref:RING-type E3 ubiquitin transferase n=1 Tax=Acer saccharum TaxID=4024 RepID=A0AA39W069_ACESA|nr:hypothetical protein LWI29_021794 [Acer saccharum]